MTYEEFHLGLTIYSRHHGHYQRYGQMVFNYLDQVRPALARGVVEAGVDCYYWEADRVHETFEWLMDNWDKEEFSD